MKLYKICAVCCLLALLQSCHNIAAVNFNHLRKTQKIKLLGVSVNRYFGVQHSKGFFQKHSQIEYNQEQVLHTVGAYAEYLSTKKNYSVNRVSKMLRQGKLSEGYMMHESILLHYLELGSNYELTYEHLKPLSKANESGRMVENRDLPVEIPDYYSQRVQNILSQNQNYIASVYSLDRVGALGCAGYQYSILNRGRATPAVQELIDDHKEEGALYLFVDIDVRKTKVLFDSRNSMVNANVKAVLYSKTGQEVWGFDDLITGSVNKDMREMTRSGRTDEDNRVLREKRLKMMFEDYFNEIDELNNFGKFPTSIKTSDEWLRYRRNLDDIARISMIHVVDQINDYIRK